VSTRRAVNWVIQTIPDGRRALALAMMERLRPWFPDAVARQRYADGADTLPMATCLAGAKVIGFLSLARPSPAAAEVFLMAVANDHQRRGAGRALLAWAEATARQGGGAQFLIVKTLGPSTPNPAYEGTRAFYQACGFHPLDEFRNWGPDNSCLLFAKHLGGRLLDHPGAGG